MVKIGTRRYAFDIRVAATELPPPEVTVLPTTFPRAPAEKNATIFKPSDRGKFSSSAARLKRLGRDLHAKDTIKAGSTLA